MTHWKIRFIYHHWLPKKLKVQGIVLFPFILFAHHRSQISKETLRHEMIHLRQIRQMGVWKFYFLYLSEYFQHLIRLKNHHQAYLSISFEKEAYELQKSPKDLS